MDKIYVQDPEVRKRVRRALGGSLCLAALVLLARSEEPAPPPVDPIAVTAPGATTAPQGVLVRVPLPLTGDADARVKRAVDRILADLPEGDGRPVRLVLEFWPQGDEGGRRSEFERSLSLARYLASAELQRVRTVAYLPRTVRGHAVLPVLACEQVIMHPEAELGEAGIDERTIEPTMLRGYEEIADRRRTFPAAVALGMLDRRLGVYLVNGDRFVLGDELERLKAAGAVTQVETISPPGEMARLSGNDLRKRYQFVSHLARDRRELAQALDLPAAALEADPSRTEPWRAVRLELTGPVNRRLVERVRGSIADQLADTPPNFILLQIDSPGGAVMESAALAVYLASLDDTQVRTVAWVTRDALADAALIAMACDHLVVDEAARLGGSGARQAFAGEIEAAVETLRRSVAREKSKSWSLWAAMIDADLEVFRVTQQGTGRTAFFSDLELADQLDPASWVKGERVTAPGETLALRGSRAYEWGLARYLAGDLEQIKQIYQIEGDVPLVRPNWAYELVDALASPQLAYFLLFVGGFALMSELMSPGIGFAGFLAGVCFLLFFWSRFLHGTADWLEVLLFVGGLFFVAMEIFVVPGFGIFGLGGAAMMIAAVILASQTFILPRNQYQFDQLPVSLLTVAAIGGGGVAALILMRHFLPRSRVFRGVMLEPPPVEELEELSRREALVDYSHLVGKRGKAATRLTPSGKGMFGDELVDVITDGELVPRGAEIVVVEVRGNHVLVAPLDAPAAPR